MTERVRALVDALGLIGRPVLALSPRRALGLLDVAGLAAVGWEHPSLALRLTHDLASAAHPLKRPDHRRAEGGLERAFGTSFGGGYSDVAVLSIHIFPGHAAHVATTKAGQQCHQVKL